MKKPLVFILLIVIGGLTSIIFSCDNKDEDDNGSNDDDTFGEDPRPECMNNEPPEIISYTLVVNGIEVGHTAIIVSSDEISLSFEYKDINCNIENAYFSINCDDYGQSCLNIEDKYSIRIPDMGCSSEEKGTPYILTLDPADFAIHPEVGVYGFLLIDSCYDSGNPSMFDIIVE